MCQKPEKQVFEGCNTKTQCLRFTLMFSLPVLGASCLRLACLLANHLWVRIGGSCLDELLHCLLFLIVVHPWTGTATGADEALRRSGLHTEVSQQAVRET